MTDHAKTKNESARSSRSDAGGGRAELLIAKLVDALRDFAEDAEGRWDMNSRSTNPGIKHCVKQARAVIAETESALSSPPVADQGVRPELHRGDIVRAVKDIRAADGLDYAVNLAILLLVKRAGADQGVREAPAEPQACGWTLQRFTLIDALGRIIACGGEEGICDPDDMREIAMDALAALGEE